MTAEPSPHNILVIDDQRDIGQLVSIVLSKRGYQTTILTDPREALTMDGKGDGVSLLLVDLGVMRGEGAVTIDELAGTFPNRPIVIMSGHPETAAYDEMQHPAVVGFLRKPFRPGDLLKFIEPPEPT